jgi:hypothetical protein
MVTMPALRRQVSNRSLAPTAHALETTHMNPMLMARATPNFSLFVIWSVQIRGQGRIARMMSSAAEYANKTRVSEIHGVAAASLQQTS